jgi:chorismate mutase
MRQGGCPIRARIAIAIVLNRNQNEIMKMSEDERPPVSERDNIASRVANFKATQEKFRREREAYFSATLEKARREPRMRPPLEDPVVTKSY